MVNTPECLIAEEARAPPSGFYTPGLFLFPKRGEVAEESAEGTV